MTRHIKQTVKCGDANDERLVPKSTCSLSVMF